MVSLKSGLSSTRRTAKLALLFLNLIARRNVPHSRIRALTGIVSALFVSSNTRRQCFPCLSEERRILIHFSRTIALLPFADPGPGECCRLALLDQSWRQPDMVNNFAPWRNHYMPYSPQTMV